MKIFDGYNVIGAGREFGLSLDRQGKEEDLIRLLSSYRARLRKKESFLVVFDGDYGTLARGKRKYRQGGIDVEWAVGETADGLIVRRVKQSRNPRGIEVITSDEEVLRNVKYARGRGVRSHDFLRKLHREAGSAAPEKPAEITAEEVDEWLALFGSEAPRDDDDAR